MTSLHEPLVAVVTTDLSAVTRGRFVAASHLDKVAATGIGWVPANLSLTPFNSIADPNPWGSSGDLRVLPDLEARFRTAKTGSVTPFDLIAGNIVELDGTPWVGCSRSFLQASLDQLEAATGLRVVAAFEQEFQVFGAALPEAHSMSFEALRRADPFASQLVAALAEAGVEPEVIIAEYGTDQFEVTHAPAIGVVSADRAVAIREITREICRVRGWKASFAPKTEFDGVGNGVHVHFSLVDAEGRPAAYDAQGPGRLSKVAGAFCAGILRHLPAMTALTAASVPSYYRLKPHAWSSSYTWLGDHDREATLRICPTVTIGGKDPSRQFNIEFRAADATANPYLVLAAIVRAGLEGIRSALPTPPLVTGDPTKMTRAELAERGLVRLPESLEAALVTFESDAVAWNWLPPLFRETYVGVKRAEIAHLSGWDAQAVCDLYRAVF